MILPQVPNISQVLSVADADQAVLTLLRYLSTLVTNIERQFVTTFATWTPGTIANGGWTSATVTVRNIAPPSPCTVGFSQALPAGMWISAVAISTDTVLITIFNLTGAPQTIAAGTLQVTVLPQT